MSTRSLLINFAGLPESPRMMVPDNGLANLAGALCANGHFTRILDYACVSTIERLFPYECQETFQLVTGPLLAKIKGGVSPSQHELTVFHELDHEMDLLQRRKVYDIAHELCDYIKKSNIDFVGLKLWIGDGFEGSCMIAQEIKKTCPGVYVFGGGPHVDWFGAKIFQYCNVFDALVYGEGEEVIVMLADFVEGKRVLDDISNLIYLRNGGVVSTARKEIDDLNALPLPAYDEDVYPAMAGNQKLKMLLIDESRGCPNRCNFCLHPMKSGRWKRKSVASIIKEMERIKRLCGIRVFRFAGSNTPYTLVREFADEILSAGMNIEYLAFINAGVDIPLSEFQRIKESGCFGFWFGIESANQEILTHIMNKNVKIDRLRATMKACKEAGLYTSGSIILPSPRESDLSKRETFDFLVDVAPDSIIIEPPVVIPGTHWANHNEKFDIEINNKDQFEESIMLYKMKMLYPPGLLQPFPFVKVNGKNNQEMMRETGEFSRRVDKEGILTQVTVDTALLAKHADMSYREFRDKNREYFMTGNSEAIAAEINTINGHMCADVAAVTASS
jgi:radical SAM superfamily enzyme YgiQ (UPF0313 family)